MTTKFRPVLAASVALVALIGSSCGVAGPEEAASIDGRSIPASVVDTLAGDEAFAALVGFQQSESEAVIAGSTARGVLDFLLQGEVLAMIAQDIGLDAEPDEAALAQAVADFQTRGYEFGLEDLSSEAREVLSRFVVLNTAFREAGNQFGEPTEADLRFVYGALEDTGIWEDRTCVTMVAVEPDLVDDALGAVEEGTPLEGIPDEVPGAQLALDGDVQCYNEAQLGTLPEVLSSAVAGAEIGEMVGPIAVDEADQQLEVIFRVGERGAVGFDKARAELAGLVAPFLPAVRTARNTEVNPRYGGPVELELVPGQPDPTTGQPGPPSLVARVSRPQAPEAPQGALLGP